MGVLGQYKIVRALRMIALDKKTTPALRMRAIEYLMEYEKANAGEKHSEPEPNSNDLQELLELVEKET